MTAKNMISIRPGTPADREILICLERDAFGPYAWADEEIGNSFAQPFVYTLFATRTSRPDEEEDGRAPGGYLVWRQIADEAEIMSIGVMSAYQRCGLAKALLAELEAQTKTLNLRRIILEVRKGNEPALALYLGYGYHHIGQRKNYYRDGSDGIVLAKLL